MQLAASSVLPTQVLLQRLAAILDLIMGPIKNKDAELVDEAETQEAQMPSASGSGLPTSGIQGHQVAVAAVSRSESDTYGRDCARARCPMDCGPPRPVVNMHTSSPRAMPWCHPCWNAQKALKMLTKNDEAAKQALQRLHDEDIEL